MDAQNLSPTLSSLSSNNSLLSSNQFIQQTNNSINFTDDLIKEYLLFRGFNLTLKSFEHDLKLDKEKSFRPEKITELLLGYVHQYDLSSLLDLWYFLEQKYISRLSLRIGSSQSLSRKYELFLLRYYLVHAVQTNKIDKVFDFFENYVSKLQSQIDWKEWFCLPFTKNPQDSPQFSVYFSKNWVDTFLVSLQNFLTILFQSIQFPKILSYDEDMFWSKNSNFQASVNNFDIFEQEYLQMELNDEFHFKNELDTLSKSSGGFIGLIKNLTNNNKSTKKNDDKLSRKLTVPSISDLNKEEDTGLENSYEKIGIKLESEEDKKTSKLEKSLETIDEPYLILSQDDYKEHKNGVILCKFSFDGKYIASVDLDGVIKVLTTDNTPTTLATIVQKTYVVSIEWERRNSNILYVGTKQNLLKVYDLQLKKFIQELSLNKSYPLVNLINSAFNNKLIVFQQTNLPNISSLATIYESNPKNNSLNQIKSIDFDHFNVSCTLSFSLNHVILGCSDGHIRLYDYEKQEFVFSQKCHEGSIINLKMTQKEDFLITIGSNEALIWTFTDDFKLDLTRRIDNMNLNGGTGNVSALDSTDNYLIILNRALGCSLISLNNRNADWKVNYRLENSNTFDLFNASHLCILVIGSQNGLLRIFKLLHQF